MASIEERVLRTIGKVAKDRTVTPESTFEDLAFDSLAIIEAVFEIEEEFDLRLPDGDVKSIRSVREVIDGIERHLAGEPLKPEADPA
jgi:acyl carrier protein